MGWGSGGGWASQRKSKTNAWQDTRIEDEKANRTQENDGMGPYGNPAYSNAPPEPPLWHGHAWQPEGVEYLPDQGRFSDGYVPGPGDKPRL